MARHVGRAGAGRARLRRARLRRRVAAALLGGAALPALVVMAATAVAQSRQQVANALRFGAIATDAPLCGLRDLSWAADLQRAELRALGADPHADTPAARQLGERALSAMSYAQGEALEEFAAAPPEATCGPLVLNPDLARADQMVDAYRAGADQPLW